MASARGRRPRRQRRRTGFQRDKVPMLADVFHGIDNLHLVSTHSAALNNEACCVDQRGVLRWPTRRAALNNSPRYVCRRTTSILAEKFAAFYTKLFFMQSREQVIMKLFYRTAIIIYNAVAAEALLRCCSSQAIGVIPTNLRKLR